ncbi:hypothetical protein J437_LFUL016294, partial [Ladona fulva]
MIGNFTSQKRAGRKRNAIPNAHSFQKPHKIMKIEGRKKVRIRNIQHPENQFKLHGRVKTATTYLYRHSNDMKCKTMLI